MHENSVIGIDLGGTNIRGGLVHQEHLSSVVSKKINSNETIEEVLNDIFFIIDNLITSPATAIGIGVPGIVDLESGIVSDVLNIPSWQAKKVALKKILEEKYQLPVVINNDANCFALGEYYFGRGKNKSSMIALTIGTGLGAGIIINNKLYSGSNCGAGEFGMVDYLDKYFEYYASGQFFQNVYKVDGEKIFADAKLRNPKALQMYKELGTHLGNAIKMIMYTYDAELIILGGSVRFAFPFFSEAMWHRIQTFAYPGAIKRLKIDVSELDNGGILGAAALCYEIEK